MILSFTVPGEPVPLARARVVSTGFGKGRRTHAYTPEKSAAYKEKVGWAAKAAIARLRGSLGTWPKAGRCTLSVEALCTSDAGDLDNHVKMASDGIQKIVFLNDRQVDEIHARRTLVETGAELRVSVQFPDEKG